MTGTGTGVTFWGIGGVPFMRIAFTPGEYPGVPILSPNIADLSWAATRALACSRIRCCWASGMTVWYPVRPGPWPGAEKRFC